MSTSRRFGMRSEAVIHRAAWHAFEDGDWDRALAVIEEGRTETAWSTGRDDWEAFIRTARQGPGDLTAILARARARVASDDVAARAAGLFPTAILHLAEDWRGTLDHAELALRPLADGSYPWPHIAAVSAVDAAARLPEAAALELWIDRATRRYTKTNHHEDVRIAYATAVAAARTGNVKTALESFAEFIGLAERRLGWPVFSGLGRLARAELLVRAGDRAAAQSDVEQVAAFWRRAKANWYLGRLADRARELGLSLSE